MESGWQARLREISGGSREIVHRVEREVRKLEQELGGGIVRSSVE